jgi:hypothetical protein
MAPHASEGAITFFDTLKTINLTHETQIPTNNTPTTRRLAFAVQPLHSLEALEPIKRCQSQNVKLGIKFFKLIVIRTSNLKNKTYR